jgi:transposase
MSRTTKRSLTDDQWRRIAPHLPPHTPSAKGGRPRARDRDCLEGIRWVLRTGAPWQAIPVDLPSGSTCWRRLRDWAAEGVLEDLHAVLVRELADLGRLDLTELLADATFIRAKKGATTSGSPRLARA